MNKGFVTYTQENRGRALLLFLLFGLAIYQFVNAGFSAFAMICMSPFLVLAVYAAFTWRMSGFWALIVVNYFIQCLNKNQMIPQGIPVSMCNELLELMLLAIAIVDARQTPHFERTGNLMFIALAIWCGFCTLEVLNDTCDLGINIGSWYGGARMMAYMLMYAFLVFTLYITTPETLMQYLRIWGILSLFSVFWTYKQIHWGPTRAEDSWLWNVGVSTHVLNGGSLIRWFSTHNDAASYGVCSAGTAIVYYVMAITARIKYDRIFFLAVGILVTWGMFQSGTRTAIFCLFAGFMIFLILSKSIKIMVPSAIIGGLFIAILMFTNIGNGNQQIRRMRSAFNKNDASSNVRAINQATMKKYIKDAPWGIGIGMGMDNVPANNKFRKLATIPPDSEYVFIWLRTGPVGITIFLITTFLMFAGACWVVLTKLKTRSLIGVGAGFCASFVAFQLGGYGNQILMNFPNCLICYGGLAIVYILPYIEPDWIKMEEKRLAEQQERERLKLEKKKASRV